MIETAGSIPMAMNTNIMRMMSGPSSPLNEAIDIL
jgi:hypothetical protein